MPFSFTPSLMFRHTNDKVLIAIHPMLDHELLATKVASNYKDYLEDPQTAITIPNAINYSEPVIVLPLQ
jgi:hypothetical protein